MPTIALPFPSYAQPSSHAIPLYTRFCLHTIPLHTQGIPEARIKEQPLAASRKSRVGLANAAWVPLGGCVR